MTKVNSMIRLGGEMKLPNKLELTIYQLLGACLTEYEISLIKNQKDIQKTVENWGLKLIDFIKEDIYNIQK